MRRSIQYWGILIAGIALAAAATQPAFAQNAPRAAVTGAPATSTDARVALVVGNSAYANSPLTNPINDARAVGKALESVGFTVHLRENLTLRGLVEAVREFGDRLRPDGVGVFYYAGHGVQIRDRNFLVPVDADIQREDEIAFQGFDAAQVLEKMERAKSRVNVVILDACRNNPFARSFRSSTQGLAAMDAPIGTLIAFATAPNRVALDGRGQHGIYTKHLLEHLTLPNLQAEIMFKRVREGVAKETRNAQIPWESSSLQGDFFFASPIGATASASASPPPPTVVAPSPAPAAAGELAIELSYWETIRTSSNRADFDAYLKRYPDGRFADLARLRLQALTASSVPPQQIATAPPTVPAVPAAESLLRALNPSLLPNKGDSWTYRYVDGFRRSTVGQLTYQVSGITPEGVTETFGYSLSPQASTERIVGPQPSFDTRSGLGFAPPDLGPYLQAFFDLGNTSTRLPNVRRQIVTDGSVEMTMRLGGKESVSVPAGRFDAIKISLVGRGQTDIRRESISSYIEIWYAPSVKRFVKYTAQSFQGNQPLELSTFELVGFKVN